MQNYWYKYRKQLGIYADFYYSPGSNTFEATENYVAGTVINVIYTPLIKGRQIVYNNNEISRIGQQTGRNGTICRYETRNDVLSSNELNKVAQTYIKYKGTAEISLTVETKTQIYLILVNKYILTFHNYRIYNVIIW